MALKMALKMALEMTTKMTTKKSTKKVHQKVHQKVAQKVAQNVAQKVAQNVARKSDEQKIIELIKDNNELTRQEMANMIGKSVKTVQRIINSCKKIRYVGSAKTGHWEVLE